MGLRGGEGSRVVLKVEEGEVLIAGCRVNVQPVM
jgi:hypothetical protein